MKVWIDAADTAARERLFGLTLVERARRALARLAPAPTVIVSTEAGAAGDRLLRDLAGSTGPVLVLDGRDVVDPRVIAHLAAGAAPRAVALPEGARLALVRAEDLALAAGAADVDAVVDRLRAAGRVADFDAQGLPGFVVNLRREVPAYGYRLTDEAARARCARAMFRANYKGSTDFLTKWVYPPLVWRLTRWAGDARLHPNLVTVAGIVLAFAAVPLFAMGAWVPGLACAYAMSVLDSVDGKLARLTLTDSPLGNLLDHGLDIVHPPLWYFAWAWALSGQGAASAIVLAGVWLCVVYVLDRLILMVAKARFKRGLHAMTPLDGAVRTVIARRNVNLVIMTVGLALGHGATAFVVVLAWHVLTALWHGARTLWLSVRPPRPLSATAGRP
jgi:phosphatidylglycerophosphate synthase